MSRDNFTPKTTRILAQRAGMRCSNPDCRRSTAGPDVTPDGTVNLGDAAHITAAAQGGPRFDKALTPQERASASNGIWLCKNCAGLVDRDENRFTVQVLQTWKAEAEAYAASLLATPERPQRPDEPTLQIPATEPSSAWLTFSSRVSRFVGREQETAEIHDFLAREEKCLWWLLSGPAGSGKSRMALEVCHSAQPYWRAGFLPRVCRAIDWQRFRPNQPTLIVVDYVNTRAEETSAIVLQLIQSRHYFPHPVRILVLEREQGSWWSRFLREDSNTERQDILDAQHAAPMLLGPMSADALLSIAADVALNQNMLIQGSDIAARIRNIDALGRPLFSMLAAVQTHEDAEIAEGPVHSILRRERARWRQVVRDEARRTRFENLVLLATMVGGIQQDEGLVRLASSDIAGLLPDLDVFDVEMYGSLVGSSMAPILAGLQPDLLGERFVLDEVATAHGKRLLAAAASFEPVEFCSFIVRSFQDFAGDPSVGALIAAVPTTTSKERAQWGALVADLVLAARRSNDLQTQQLLEKLRLLVATHVEELSLRESLARAEFFLANILMMLEGNQVHALEQYEKALAYAAPASKLAAEIVNNRGIVNQHLRGEEQSFADWTKVAEMAGASDEARACALNNRADIFAQRGDHEAAVRDRSSVLALAETTHNRRYIALSRRSRSLVSQGLVDEALRDLTTILDTPDISDQQKASAQLDRARLLIFLTRLGDARRDIAVVLASEPVFPGTHEDALVALAELDRLDRDTERAHEHLNAVLSATGTSEKTLVEAFVVLARLLEDSGDAEAAGRVWAQIAGEPRSNSRQRAEAEERVKALKPGESHA